MNVHTFVGIVAAFALLIPVAIIFIYRLAVNRSLLALAIYFLFAAFYNLMDEGIIPVGNEVTRTAGIINNYLDAPLVLFSLLFFCTTSRQQKILQITLVIFAVYEVVVTAALGFNINAIVYILGPGILLLFICALYFFVKYARMAIEKNKQVGKTIMLAAMVFAYGCYGMIYCFHYIQKTPARADVFLIYYIASIIASLIMSSGLIWISKRGQKIKEVQITRRELAIFFNR
jgi:hypothetical protein